MARTNHFGLSDDIGKPVKRLVRQDCGFACVICGKLGMHYDHFDPEFVDCREHNPDGIALLCPTCHQDKSSHRLSNETVALARARAKERWKDPAWMSQFTGENVSLKFGSNLLTGKKVGIWLGAIKILTIEAGDDALESWTLSGNLVHGAGQVARFEKNNVVACSGNWDVELKGQLLTFRSGTGQIVLMLSLQPNQLGIERLDLQWASGVNIIVNPEGDVILNNLRHTGRNNYANNLVFRRNRIINSFNGGFPPPPIPEFMNKDRIIDGAECSDNYFEVGGGIADLGWLIDVNSFLSADMLSLE